LPNGCRLRWWPLLLLGWLVAISAPAAAQRDCSPATIAKARREFQRAYDAKDYERAAAFIEPIELDCVANRVDDIDPVLAAAISSDAAITAHRQGDDGECLQWLLEYLPSPRHGNPKLNSLPAGLRAAITHNVELCKPHCAMASAMDASCASINAVEELDRMVIGDFAEKPCLFETGGSPTLAVSKDRCLVLFAPPPQPKPDPNAAAEDPDPERACPGVALVRRSTNGPVTVSVSVPAHSILRRIRLCCSAINLASDRAGRIEVTPAENPPEDCLSGHRSSAKQDLMELRGDTLILRHRLDAGDDD